MNFPYCVKFVYFHWAKICIRYQTLRLFSAAKQQNSGKSLKLKCKPVKELEKGTPRKYVASVFDKTLSTWKKSKTLQSYQNGLGAQRVKPEKYEALNKALKKLLLILRSEIMLVNRSLLKKKALEFVKELSIEGFQVSEVWLKMVNEKYGQ